MGETVDVLGVEPHPLEQVAHAALDLLARGAVQAHRRSHDLDRSLARVQRSLRILEDHLHLPSHWPKLAPAGVADVTATEADRSRRRLEQTDQRARKRRLAAARLTDDAQRLTLHQLKGDVVHGVHVRDRAVDQQPSLDREVDHQMFGLQQRCRPGVARWRSRHRLAGGRRGACCTVGCVQAITVVSPARPIRPSMTRLARFSSGESQQRSRCPETSASRDSSAGTSLQRENSCGQRGRK